MPSKYDALTKYLKLVDREAIRLKFSRIEEIVGSPLPASAHKYPQWWENQSQQYPSAAWMAAGWRKTDHSFQGEWVEFTKD